MRAELRHRARNILQQLQALSDARQPGSGVHGQVIGLEPWVIRTNGNGLQCLHDVQELVQELLTMHEGADDEPDAGDDAFTLADNDLNELLNLSAGMVLGNANMDTYMLWESYLARVEQRMAGREELLAMLKYVVPFIPSRTIDAELARKGPLSDAFVNNIVRRCIERAEAPSPEASPGMAPIDTQQFLDLMGRYWGIAFNEGATGESHGDQAQAVLSATTAALTELCRHQFRAGQLEARQSAQRMGLEWRARAYRAEEALAMWKVAEVRASRHLNAQRWEYAVQFPEARHYIAMQAIPGHTTVPSVDQLNALIDAANNGQEAA